MTNSHSTRLAWSVALASLTLWATSLPTTAGQVAAGATRLFDDTLTPTADQIACPPEPAKLVSADGTTTTTFHLCGADQGAEQRIAQLIDGHAFNASIAAYGDGCADLTLRVLPEVVSGRAASHLAVSLGEQRSIQLDIASEAGVTRVRIGPAE